jgi:hypothetical protein
VDSGLWRVVRRHTVDNGQKAVYIEQAAVSAMDSGQWALDNGQCIGREQYTVGSGQ